MVKPGRVMFELEGVPEDVAKPCHGAWRRHKLPVRSASSSYVNVSSARGQEGISA